MLHYNDIVEQSSARINQMQNFIANLCITLMLLNFSQMYCLFTWLLGLISTFCMIWIFELFAPICPNKEINTSQTQVKTKVEISAYPKQAQKDNLCKIPDKCEVNKHDRISIKTKRLHVGWKNARQILKFLCFMAPFDLSFFV